MLPDQVHFFWFSWLADYFQSPQHFDLPAFSGTLPHASAALLILSPDSVLKEQVFCFFLLQHSDLFPDGLSYLPIHPALSAVLCSLLCGSPKPGVHHLIFQLPDLLQSQARQDQLQLRPL